MFAGIMGIAVILFTLMSWNYKYVEEIKNEDEKKRLSAVSNHKSDSSSSSSSDSDDEKGKENKGFSE
jgi:hypothetical protein